MAKTAKLALESGVPAETVHRVCYAHALEVYGKSGQMKESDWLEPAAIDQRTLYEGNSILRGGREPRIELSVEPRSPVALHRVDALQWLGLCAVGGCAASGAPLRLAGRAPRNHGAASSASTADARSAWTSMPSGAGSPRRDAVAPPARISIGRTCAAQPPAGACPARRRCTARARARDASGRRSRAGCPGWGRSTRSRACWTGTGR